MTTAPEFYTAFVTNKKTCHRFEPEVSFLVLKVRGHDTVELSFDNSNDTFQLTPTDGFLYLGPSIFSHICYRKMTETSSEKVRLDMGFG
jgi:hypothetical protein